MDQSNQLTWTVEKRKVADLKNWDKNPRKITDGAFKKLKERIQKRGMHDVVKTDGHDVVLSGNQRKRALQELGVIEVFAMIPSRELTEEEKNTVALESNRNDGQWDWDMLANTFEIDNLKDVGFSSSELGFMQQGAEEDDFDSDAEMAKITTPESKLGEVYELGRHRLMCGSSTVLVDVEKLMNGEKANLVFTDPPYSVDYRPQTGAVDPKRHTRGYGDKGIFNDNKSDEEAIVFYTDILKNLLVVTEDNAPIYWWFAMSKIELNLTAFRNAGWKVSQNIIWLKNYMTFSRGVDYHRMYEPCLFGWKEGKTHFQNKKICDTTDVMNLDIEDFSLLLDVWYQKRDSVNTYVHPTQKPVRLAGRAIRKSSIQGNNVVDLFGGSGSTLIACEQMDRKCFTMELDPKYCDVIRKRYEQYVKSGTGK